MTIDITLASSRPVGVAQEVLGKPVSAETMLARHVVLTGETALLTTPNGRWAYVDALRLLLCVVGRLTVVVPPSAAGLRELVDAITARARSRRPPVIVTDLALVDMCDDVAAVLNIGNEVRDPNTWSAITSNGWVAYVSSQRPLTTTEFGQDNAIAALLAASLGVAEVFKRLIGIPPEIAPLIDRAALSLFDFSDGASGPGPVLPHDLELGEALLVGAGAIGNGIALLLSQLPARGNLHILDKQDYGQENFGTCLLLEVEGWLAPKAERLAAWLRANSRIVAKGTKATIEETIAAGTLSSPTLALSALDDVSARREVQRLWPRILVDGGINSVGAAVTQYRLARPDYACLMCWFEESRQDLIVLQSKMTGLSPEALAGDQNRPLTDEDIAQAAEERRDFLRECKRQGKTICSTIPAREAEARLGLKTEESFRPSVPFVATASAAMVVAEATKAIAFPEEKFPAMFQMGNLFLGPEASAPYQRAPNQSCPCVTQRSLIERIYLKPMEGP